MPPSSHGASCRDHLLNSAEEVVLRAGVGALTLDAVAAQARVSKGGLLYHFPSKDALIESMVKRTCENWRTDYTQAIGAVDQGPGRVPRGLMSMCIGSPDKWTQTLRRSSVVLVAVLANNPSLVKPLRDVYRNLFDLLRHDRQSAQGELVVLALNGLWFEFIFGLQDMSPNRLRGIRDSLETLLKDSAPEPRATRNSKPARRATRRATRP
ncbi:MAG: TetR/AcrR family transcriptional regulator [Phycisphaerales bacterium]|nr:TetR/AcrR family transcriptional regulator [Phycisphaerales bacterium]